MSERGNLLSALAGRAVAVPESRQLDILAALFERRQARVLRVPLVCIHDAPDQEAVLTWLHEFVAQPPELLVLLTGEGLRRLRAAAQRAGFESDFLAAVATVKTLCRGPKPVRALKEAGLTADYLAATPTTSGVITTLESMELAGRQVAVQLYGEEPNPELMSYLAGLKLAACRPVAPYVYGDDADTGQVVSLIQSLAAGAVDLIAFTSKPQVRRLFAVAEAAELGADLQTGLARTYVAAVGPVVKAELETRGCRVAIMPDSTYFMKPLVRAAERVMATDN